METGIERLHGIINKEETVQQHRDAIDLATKYGMTTALFMIFGLPTETHEDRDESFKIVQSMGTKESKYNNLIPYPGTPMYKSLKSNNRVHVEPAWANFNSTLSVTRSIFDKTPLPYVPETASEFDGEEIQANKHLKMVSAGPKLVKHHCALTCTPPLLRGKRSHLLDIPRGTLSATGGNGPICTDQHLQP